MPIVRELLQKKTKGVWTISPDAPAFEGVQTMAENDVGALVVMENNEVVGIVTERDYIKKLLLKERSLKDTYIREIMSTKALSVSPEHTTDACMTMMTDHHVRHLPVVENDGTLIGIVSIRDVVRQIVQDQEFMIMQLEDYIMACPPHLKDMKPGVR